MATKDNKENLNKKLKSASNASSVAINGLTDDLDMENLELKNIIRQTSLRSSIKYGQKTAGKSLDYFTELNLSKVMADATVNKDDVKAKKLADNDPKQYLKKYMLDRQIAERTGLLTQDVKKVVAYQNYKAIFKHIPECATALKIYRDNILSPDDYTKNIFNYDYVGADNKDKIEKIKDKIDFLLKKYKFNKKTLEIIQDAILLGDSYVAVLSINDELEYLLSDPSVTTQTLQESIHLYDKDLPLNSLNEYDIKLDESQKKACKNFLQYNNINITEDTRNNTSNLNEQIVKLVNEHFEIGSKLELLKERAEYEYAQKNKNSFMSDIITPNEKKEKSENKQKPDDKPLNLNGSVIRYLNPENTIKLEIDGICYGYYYHEESKFNSSKDISDAGDYLGATTGKSQSNMTAISTPGAGVPTGSSTMAIENIDDATYNLISDVFLSAISKKINKEYVRHNKEFKDYIYSIVKEQNFINTKTKLTYFTPDEVVHFECEPIYKNIPFFAKLYLAVLTNMVVINLGRGHDKRVFYVSTGLDAQFEAALTNTIESIKSKEFRLSDNDINTVLSLNPGALDDWFIPIGPSGDRPIEIDTLAGMDIDISNNTFLDWLRKSMMNGMYIPSSLIDAMAEIDYARSLSSQNAQFVRSIIQYQMTLQEPFTQLVKQLYKNEYRFADDAEMLIEEDINLDKIVISFPSPASLNMTNMQEQISTASAIADELSMILIPPKQDGSSDDLRYSVKTEVFKKFFPGFNYKEMEDKIEEIKIRQAKDNLKTNLDNPPEQDPYGQGMGY